MPSRAILAATCCAAALALGPSSARAQGTTGGRPAPAPAPQDDAAARTHFERGVALFNAQDYNAALAEFQAAYEISRRPTVLYNIGVTQQALRRYPEAARAIEQYLREATITPEQRAQITQGLAQIRDAIAHVQLSGLPPGATVTIDGEPLDPAHLSAPIAVGAGRHVIEVQAPGFRDGREVVLIAGGQEREVRVDLAREAAAPSPPGATTASIVVRGTPPGATVEIDGRSVPPGREAEVVPGSHTVRVTARGFEPWEGRVEVPAGAHFVASVRLVPSGRLTPAPLLVGAGATVALGVAGAVMGLNTLATGAEFERYVREGRAQNDPDALAAAARGTTQRTITNVLFGATAVAGAVSLVLLTRTSFGPTGSTVDVAFAPRLEGGGEGSLRVRF